MKANYRGYDIELHRADGWSAEIVNAATGKAWSQRASVPLEAGQAACLRRAQNLVDAFLALHGARQA